MHLPKITKIVHKGRSGGAVRAGIGSIGICSSNITIGISIFISICIFIGISSIGIYMCIGIGSINICIIGIGITNLYYWYRYQYQLQYRYCYGSLSSVILLLRAKLNRQTDRRTNLCIGRLRIQTT